MFKRLFDIAVAFIAIVILLPVILSISILVRCNLGSPILFRQERPGLNGKPFNMFKFRTMKDSLGLDGKQLPDEARLTSFGNTLRSSSLDELPGLISVLKGDMSLVGPRPLLMEYLPLYNEVQAKRHLVRPGITGWAQVNGRNAISWEQKFDFDNWYVENQSFWLDIKILLLTIKKVVVKEGISSDGHSTVEPFTGSNVDDKDKP